MLIKSQENYPDTPKAYLHINGGPDAIVDPDMVDFLSGFTWRWKKIFSL